MKVDVRPVHDARPLRRCAELPGLSKLPRPVETVPLDEHHGFLGFIDVADEVYALGPSPFLRKKRLRRSTITGPAWLLRCEMAAVTGLRVNFIDSCPA